MRFENIDFLKGTLIILVIIGHALQGATSENILRYVIYSFHMPIFIGIAGFLFNSSKIGLLSFKQLFEKYLFRALIPWVIAVFVYMIRAPQIIKHLSIGKISHEFLYPHYHLWFIPAFLSWVFITWLLKKCKLNENMLLLFGSIFSLMFMALLYYPILYKTSLTFNNAFELIFNTFRPQFYVFFVLGIFLRSHKFESKSLFNLGIVIVSFLITIFLYFNPIKLLTITMFLAFNCSFLILLITKAKEDLLPKSQGLQWLGRNSLAIYLWHVIPIMIVTKLVGVDNLKIFYGITAIAEVLFIVLITQLAKVRLINKYIFGMDS